MSSIPELTTIPVPAPTSVEEVARHRHRLAMLTDPRPYIYVMDQNGQWEFVTTNMIMTSSGIQLSHMTVADVISKRRSGVTFERSCYSKADALKLVRDPYSASNGPDLYRLIDDSTEKVIARASYTSCAQGSDIVISSPSIAGISDEMIYSETATPLTIKLCMLYYIGKYVVSEMSIPGASKYLGLSISPSVSP